MDGYGGDDTATASQVRRHYEKKFRDRQKSEAGEPAVPAEPSPAAHTPFQGSISSVFSSYLTYALMPCPILIWSRAAIKMLWYQHSLYIATEWNANRQIWLLYASICPVNLLLVYHSLSDQRIVFGHEHSTILFAAGVWLLPAVSRWTDTTVLLVGMCRVYVDKAEQELSATLDTLIREETWQPMEDAGDTHVLHSASALFAALKHTLGQCSKNISKGPAMLDLMRAFQAGPAAIASAGRVAASLRPFVH